ncbi:MAG: ABC transporter substrate-binding protein, partial [Oscillospiraceae bacterium]|nr:ABC transporter substrate-binding protein [Oscillospiraceae bacterium]
GGKIAWNKDQPTDNQMDIFLITSSEMFEKYASADRLAQLDDELNTKAKVLNEYIHPSIMMAGQYNGKTLAIPTNKAIGTFTYIAVNKRLADKYGLDLTKVKDYSDLTDYLVQVKANEPDVALMEGPFEPVNKFDQLFTDMPDFAIQSAAGKSLVYTPQQDPTEPPPTTTAAPETDADGNVVTSEATTAADTADAQDTTIPPTTSKPQPIPAKTNTTPDAINISNMYTNSAYDNVAKTNQDFRDKGLFETAPIPDGKERAAFVFTGTLEEQMARQAADKYDYDYIVYANPMATKSDLQNGMYAVSVSSPSTVTRAMEVITMMNTNTQFKNIFEYGVEGTNYIVNDSGLIQRTNQDYMVDMNYTGNNFIADLTTDDNPNKWEIAKQQNLSVVNSVFLNFYLDKTKLTPASLASLDPINTLSQEVKQALLTGNIPTDYADIASYISDYVTPAFKDAGADDLITDIKNQTNPS